MAKKVSVTPLHDRVIVKAAAAEEKTAGKGPDCIYRYSAGCGFYF